MGGVMVDEGAEHPIELGLRAVAALRFKRLFDHAAGATADHHPGILIGEGRQALTAEDEVERCDQVGGGIDEGAVEVEGDGEHGVSPKRPPVLAQAATARARSYPLGSWPEGGYTAPPRGVL